MKNILFLVLLLLGSTFIIGQTSNTQIIDSLIVENQGEDALSLIEKELEAVDITKPEKIALLTQKVICHAFLDKTEKAKASLFNIKNLVSSIAEVNDDNKARIAIGETLILRSENNNQEAQKIFNTTLNEVDFSKVSPIISVKFHQYYASLMRIKKNIDSIRVLVDRGTPYLADITNPHIQNILKNSLLDEKGKSYQMVSEYKKAREIFSQLLDIAYAERDTLLIGRHCTNIAVGYFYSGDFGQCAHYVKKAMEVRLKKYGDQSNQALGSYQNLAVVYMKMENYEDANIYYEKAYDLIKELKGESNPSIARLHFNIGIGHFQKGDFDQAIERFKKSLKIRQDVLEAGHSDIAHSLQLLGDCHLNKNEYEIAQEYFEKALTIREASADKKNADLVRLYTNLTYTNNQKGDYTTSKKYIKKAYNALGYDSETPFDFTVLDNPFMLSNPLEAEIKTLFQQYQDTKDEKNYLKAKTPLAVADSIMNFLKYSLDDPASRMAIMFKQKTLFDEIISLHNVHFENVKDEETLSKIFRLIEKGNNGLMYEKIASNESETLLGIPASIIEEKYNLEDSLYFYEEKILSEEGKSNTKVISKVTEFKDRYYAFMQKIKKEYPKYFQTVYEYPIVTIDNYKKVLNENETSISYYLGSKNVLALTVTNTESKLYNLGKSTEIEESIKAYLTLLKDRSEKSKYETAAKEIYNILVKPLDIKDDESLTLVCDNILNLIPFGALIKEDERYLFESNIISYQYSATTRSLKKKQSSSKTKMLAMAPIFEEENTSKNVQFASLYEADIFRDELGPLLQSENELNNIEKNIGGKFLYRESATEKQFKKEAPHASIIHLATHGFANQDKADNSRLYFNQANDTIEDGMLNAYEIVNMDINADLVTLSACNTGSGKVKSGEGIASLGRAFAYAGAPNQLLSLWSVNDRSTTQLMTNYYNNLTKGESKSEALRSAQLEYLKTAPEIMRHPYYWAGFVYYGDDQPLLLSNNSTRIVIYSILG